MTSAQRLIIKPLAFWVIFLAHTFPLISQVNYDSLYNKLAQSSPVETRNIFKQLVYAIPKASHPSKQTVDSITNRISRSITYQNTEKQLFTQINQLTLLAKYFDSLDIPVAEKLYQTAKQQGYQLAKADIAQLLGITLSYTIDQSKALSYILEASQLYEQFNMESDASKCYYTASLINYWAGNFSTARLYYQHVVNANFAGLSQREHINMVNTGGLIAKKQHHLDSALQLFKRTVKLAETYQDSAWIGIANGNIGDVHFAKGEFDLARPFLLKDLSYSRKFNVRENIVISLNQLGDMAYQEQKLQEAYRYYREAAELLEISLKGQRIESVVRTYHNLATVCKDLHIYKQAFEYLEKSDFWQDSLFALSKETELLAIQADHDYEKQEKELIALKKQQELSDKNQQLKLTVAMVSGGILAIALFYIWVIYRRQKNVNILLNQQKQQIESQKDAIQIKNQELIKREGVFQELLEVLVQDEQKMKTQNQRLLVDKEQLMEQVTHHTHELLIKNKELIQNNTQLEQFNYVIAHNIRGPVARLLGLFQLYETSSAEEQQLLWPKLIHSVHDIDTVIKDLNTTLRIKKNIDEVFETVDLHQLINRLFQTLQDEIEYEQAEISLNLEVTHIQSVKAYIESILYNLLSNAIKYKDPRRPLKIHISTQSISNRTIIEVVDNGLGIDLEKYHDKLFGMYKRFHQHKEGKGLGLHLVKLQVESLGGHIAVESERDKGSTFKVYL